MKNAAWFSAGAASCLAIGALIVRSVFNCSLDGPTFWTAIGSIAVIATGIVAALNLTAFMDTERVKITLGYIDRFNRDGVDKESAAITSEAYSNYATIRDLNFETYSEAVEAAKHVEDGAKSLRAAAAYGAIQQRYLDVHNYFTQALTLLDRHTMDAGLFFAILGQTVVDVNYAGGKVMEQVGLDLKYDLSALETLAKRAAAQKPPISVTASLLEVGDKEAPAAG